MRTLHCPSCERLYTIRLYGRHAVTAARRRSLLDCARERFGGRSVCVTRACVWNEKRVIRRFWTEMATADQLKLDPPTVVFTSPFTSSRSNHQMTNSGACRLTVKVKCTHPDQILATPVFALIEAGKSMKLVLHGRFKDGPDPKQVYRVYIQFAEAPAAMAAGDDQQKLRAGWAGIKDAKVVKLSIEFKQAEAAPATTPAAAPAPAAAETPTPDTPGAAETAPEATPAEEQPPAQ